MTQSIPTTPVTTEEPGGDDDPVAAIMAAFGPDVLNRMNVDFEDSVLLVGRILGERPQATAARITEVDRHGVNLVVTDPAGDHDRRVAFAATITEIGQLTEELLGMVVRAREASGEAGTTSGEREFAKLAGIRTFITEVVVVADVNPHCRRITFGGGDLDTLRPVGPDSFLYLLVPPPGCADLSIDQSFTWDGYWQMPESERPVGAYFTVWEWRPESSEVDILFVLHDDPGHAVGWARRAGPGDPAALWGPRTAFEPPADTEWYLLVGDDTGLPAIANILGQLPAGVTARVFVEVEGPEEHLDLPVSPTVHVTWLHRDGAKPGTASLLPDAVRQLDWPGGIPYAWGGGESRTMTQVRRYLRQEVGLARDAVTLQAYWRHADHADENDDDVA